MTIHLKQNQIPLHLRKYFRPAGVKQKDDLQIPQRFALAAQADGWFLRSAIVWAKGLSFLPDYAGSCMPESVTDRPTQSYEMVYMLAKSERYFCDMESVKEPNAWPDHNRFGNKNAEARLVKELTGNMRPDAPQETNRTGRNLRNVWAISPTGFAAAHFACWPERLVEPMIKMGTSARGACPTCGAPWRRVVERTASSAKADRGTDGTSAARAVNGNADRSLHNGASWYENANSVVTTGWEPTCTCDATEPVPCTVLDPFSGSGTTGKVAVRLGRRYIGVDLSEKYLGEITDARLGAGVQMELSW